VQLAGVSRAASPSLKSWLSWSSSASSAPWSCRNCWANGWKEGGYVEKLPKDPWGNSYQYLSPGLHGEVDIFSFGADGQANGEGEDADVGSWQQ
jgi:type II secretion system protein G